MNLWAIESEYLERGFEVFCGVDEAGRGPLAGPVFASAVILPFKIDIPGLDDSKKLVESKREELFNVITENALAFSIASASHEEVDDINILQATYLVMNRAIDGLLGKISDLTDKAVNENNPELIILIDGNRNDGIKHNSVCIVGGDKKSASIAAASILAKVSRDRYMVEMANKYPMYGFEKHKGYGTKLHYEKLKEFGPCDIHRTTFIKKLNFPSKRGGV